MLPVPQAGGSVVHSTGLRVWPPRSAARLRVPRPLRGREGSWSSLRATASCDQAQLAGADGVPCGLLQLRRCACVCTVDGLFTQAGGCWILGPVYPALVHFAKLFPFFHIRILAAFTSTFPSTNSSPSGGCVVGGPSFEF